MLVCTLVTSGASWYSCHEVRRSGRGRTPRLLSRSRTIDMRWTQQRISLPHGLPFAARSSAACGSPRSSRTSAPLSFIGVLSVLTRCRVGPGRTVRCPPSALWGRYGRGPLRPAIPGDPGRLRQGHGLRRRGIGVIDRSPLGRIKDSVPVLAKDRRWSSTGSRFSSSALSLVTFVSNDLIGETDVRGLLTSAPPRASGEATRTAARAD
jgi:hypothetical protein